MGSGVGGVCCGSDAWLTPTSTKKGGLIPAICRRLHPVGEDLGYEKPSAVDDFAYCGAVGTDGDAHPCPHGTGDISERGHGHGNGIQVVAGTCSILCLDYTGNGNKRNDCSRCYASGTRWEKRRGLFSSRYEDPQKEHMNKSMSFQ